MSEDINRLQKRIEEFKDRRGWLRFHSPKNISMALAAKNAELMEHFQWLSEAKSKEISDSKK